MIKLLGLPVLASEHGSEVDKLILYVHLLMGALFVGWMAYFLYVLFRFRKSRNPKASYTGVTNHSSSYIEGAVVIVEAILLVGFAVPLWAKAVDRFPSERESTVIRVTAEQFAWNVRYAGADGIFGKQDMSLISNDNPLGIDKNDPASKDDVIPTAVGQIYLPVNKPAIAHITSKDVIHSFKLNTLRVTQDATPGLSIPVWFKPTVEGTSLINCAQLCGGGHYTMRGFLNIVSQERFDEWIAQQPKVGAGAAAGFE
jgi:cytochrome c oxidase subunit 2